MLYLCFLAFLARSLCPSETFGPSSATYLRLSYPIPKCSVRHPSHSTIYKGKYFARHFLAILQLSEDCTWFESLLLPFSPLTISTGISTDIWTAELFPNTFSYLISDNGYLMAPVYQVNNLVSVDSFFCHTTRLVVIKSNHFGLCSATSAEAPVSPTRRLPLPAAAWLISTLDS